LHLHLLDYTVHTYNNLKAFQVVTGNGVLVNSKATVLGLKEYTLSYSLLAKKLNLENFHICLLRRNFFSEIVDEFVNQNCVNFLENYRGRMKNNFFIPSFADNKRKLPLHVTRLKTDRKSLNRNNFLGGLHIEYLFIWNSFPVRHPILHLMK
jgi:hypothetical protein